MPKTYDLVFRVSTGDNLYYSGPLSDSAWRSVVTQAMTGNLLIEIDNRLVNAHHIVWVRDITSMA